MKVGMMLCFWGIVPQMGTILEHDATARGVGERSLEQKIIYYIVLCEEQFPSRFTWLLKRGKR